MNFKKVLAMVLCVAMVLGTMGTVAFAETEMTAVNGDIYSSVIAKEITENGLTYAVKFEGQNLVSGYTNCKMNVELTSNIGMTLEFGNDLADGYLSAILPNYPTSPFFGEIGWRNIPQGSLFGGEKMDAIKLEAGKPIKVLDYYMTDLFGGNNTTAGYEDLFGTHRDMSCGVFLNEAFLNEYGDDLYIEFALNIYEYENSKVKNTYTLATYSVGEKPSVATVDGVAYATIDEALAAIDNGSVVVINEGTYDVALNIPANKSNVTIKAANNTTKAANNAAVKFTQCPTFKGTNYRVEGIDFVYEDSYNNLGGTGAIVDCDFTATKNTFRYCYADGGEITFDGCNVTAGAGYWALHFDETGGLDLNVIDSKFSGNFAIAGDLKSLTADGTTFADAYVNVWGTAANEKAIFEDCEFTNTSYVFLGWDDTNDAEFTNCTVNSTPMDAEILYNANANVTVDGEELKRVAVSGNSYYSDVQYAIDSVKDGATVTLINDQNDLDLTIAKKIVLDLNGYTIYDAYIKTASEVEITNGYIVNTNESYPIVVNSGSVDVTNVSIEASKSDRAIWVRDNGTLNFNGSTIIATKGANNSNSKIYGIVINKNATANINGGEIIVDAGEKATAVAILGNYENADVNMTAGKISTSGKDFGYGIQVDGDVTITGGEIVTNEKEYGYTSGIHYGKNYAINSKGDVSIANAKITTYGPSGYLVNAGGSNQTVELNGVEFENVMNEYDVTNGGHKAPAIINGSDVTATIASGTYKGINQTMIKGTGSALAISGGMFDADPTEYLASGLGAYQTATGKYTIDVEKLEADTIKVEFEKVTSKEGELLYNINLKGADGETINRLNSADLTFDFDPTAVVDGKMKFEIIDIADDNIHVAPVNNSKVRYEFHFDTKTDVNDTAKTITIAQVKFTGYGTFDFAVDSAANETNAVHATTHSDNLVDTFVPGGAAAGLGTLDINAKLEGVENKVPTRKLTVEITFPNAIEYDNTVAYQDMKVTIVGGNQNIEIDLAAEADYTFTKVLPYETAYTVTVSGAGYRTATYTVQLTEDKTLNFWNNVMDRELEVEVKNSTSKTVKNFLAGDIVGDDEINIYDLSAAVSYFGTNTKGDAKYSKYDLNRDGKIDSKDVAFILVSWGE